MGKRDRGKRWGERKVKRVGLDQCMRSGISEEKRGKGGCHVFHLQSCRFKNEEEGEVNDEERR